MNELDVAIIGAGPSGLASALVLAKTGLNVSVFEKNDELGQNPRGETIRPDPRIDALLGPGFLESQKVHKVKHRTYFSHTGHRTADREISSWNYIIHWDRFIKEMGRQVVNAGAKVLTKSNITNLKSVEPGKTLLQLGKKEITARVIIDCSGASNSKKLLPGQRIPIQKKIISGFEGDENRFYYFFHVDKVAPMIASIFPRGNKEAELLLMLLTDCSSNPDFSPSLNDADFIMDGFAADHPKFAQLTDQCSITSKYCTTIPMKEPGSRFYSDGIFYTGDNLGLIESRGGSGIKSSIVMAAAMAQQIHKYWPDPLSEGKRIADYLKNHSMFKELQSMDRKFGRSRRMLFSTIQKPGQMDFMWPMLQFFLR